MMGVRGVTPHRICLALTLHSLINATLTEKAVSFCKPAPVVINTRPLLHGAPLRRTACGVRSPRTLRRGMCGMPPERRASPYHKGACTSRRPRNQLIVMIHRGCHLNWAFLYAVGIYGCVIPSTAPASERPRARLPPVMSQQWRQEDMEHFTASPIRYSQSFSVA